MFHIKVSLQCISKIMYKPNVFVYTDTLEHLGFDWASLLGCERA